MTRRVLLCAALLAAAGVRAQQPALRSIVVLDLDFIEDHPRADADGAQARRLAAAHRQLQQELVDAGLYRVLDLAPALPLLEQLRSQQTFMHRCESCVQSVGRRLDADLAMTAWVQKVSELILNINVEVYDVASARSLLSKSVDLRGNTDETWRRAVTFLVRDLADRRRRDPRYGQ